MLAVVYLAILALVASACSGSDKDDDGPALPPPPPAAPAAYRIVYDVRVGEETSRRELTVQRPFAASDVTFAGGADRPNGGSVSTATNFYALQTEGFVDFGARAGGAPASDYRVDRVLADLRSRKLAVPQGSARVAGRSCRIYRIGSPLGDPLQPIGPEEHADLCIDDAGRVLSERWELQGKVLRETTATSVTEKDVPPVRRPDGEGRVAPTQFGEVEALPRDEAPDVDKPYWASARPPWGFRLVRRERAASTGLTATGPQISNLAYVDTYVRGPDAVQVIHQEQDAPPPSGSDTVVAGPLGRGAVTMSLTGTTLEFAPPGWSVTVTGPLDVARLTAFAASLRPTS